MIFDIRQNEKVIDIIRKSFYILIPDLFKSFSLIIPAIYILLYVDIPLLTLISFVWIIIILAYVLNIWLVWYYGAYILTSERVIEINQKSLFSREVIELPLEKIKDVIFSIDGIASALFGYGTVKIISDSSINIDMRDVKNPEETRELILELKKDK